LAVYENDPSPAQAAPKRPYNVGIYVAGDESRVVDRFIVYDESGPRALEQAREILRSKDRIGVHGSGVFVIVVTCD
jgi:uncharacterized protein YxjI